MMDLSTKGRYATRIMVCLALHESAAPARKREIARSEGISANYAEQILVSLKSRGLVRSIRGASGGFMLGKDAEDISVLDVLEATEGALCLAPCETDPCERRSGCVVRALWRETEESVRAVLSRRSIGNLAAEARKFKAKRQALSYAI